jgi:hypothetical protein
VRVSFLIFQPLTLIYKSTPLAVFFCAYPDNQNETRQDKKPNHDLSGKIDK